MEAEFVSLLGPYGVLSARLQRSQIRFAWPCHTALLRGFKSSVLQWRFGSKSMLTMKNVWKVTSHNIGWTFAWGEEHWQAEAPGVCIRGPNLPPFHPPLSPLFHSLPNMHHIAEPLDGVTVLTSSISLDSTSSFPTSSSYHGNERN
ncbi:hypothetical protein TcWFU_001556 [Taenia crassiceps]|uniref:Uncharacterized protein n=1 Tax=Taenia crassiceps TaxID=6207 RepID=A0ABR4QCR3_9CEST